MQLQQRVWFAGALALALAWAVGTPVARAADYVVSTAGSDGAGGWRARPGAPSSGRNAGTLRAGDAVTVEDGTYAGFACDGRRARPRRASCSARATDGARRSPRRRRARRRTSCSSPRAATSPSTASRCRARPGRASRSSATRTTAATPAASSSRTATRTTTAAPRPPAATTASSPASRWTSPCRTTASTRTGEHGIYVSNAADNPAILRNDVANTGANCIQINADLSTGGDGLISNWRIEGNIVRNCKGPPDSTWTAPSAASRATTSSSTPPRRGITLFQGDGAEASHDK